MTEAEYWRAVLDDLIMEMADLEEEISRAAQRLEEAEKENGS